MFSSRGFSSFSHILQLVLIKMLMKCSSRGWRTQNLLQSACRQNLLGVEWWRLSMPRHLASKSTNTYRRICHASSHLVGASIGRGAVATCEASRRRHLHFVGGIHGHGAHAAARREVLFELQRFGRAFEWRWRINFAAFLFHLSGKSFFQVISMLQVFFVVEFQALPTRFRLSSLSIFIKNPSSLQHRSTSCISSEVQLSHRP